MVRHAIMIEVIGSHSAEEAAQESHPHEKETEAKAMTEATALVMAESTERRISKVVSRR